MAAAGYSGSFAVSQAYPEDSRYGTRNRWLCLQLLGRDESQAFLNVWASDGRTIAAALTQEDMDQLQIRIDEIRSVWAEKNRKAIVAKVDAILADPEVRTEIESRF